MNKLILKMLTVLFFAATLILSAQIGKAHAFIGTGVNTDLYHSYDGLVCRDCHTMHNVKANLPGSPPVVVSGPVPQLLVKETVTDLCLGCHHESGAWAFDAPVIMTFDGVSAKDKGISMPGGDFYWSRLDPKKGHNPGRSFGNQAASMTYDSVLTTSPGGSFVVDGNWDCVTCHGAHDRFGNGNTAWRQVKRKVNNIVHTGDVRSFGVESVDPGPDFVQDVNYEPILSNSRGDVRGIDYLPTKRGDDTAVDGANLFFATGSNNHNVYRGGFSSFCSVCHGDFHGDDEVSGDPSTSSSGNTADGTSKHWKRHPTNVALNDADGKYTAAKYMAPVTNTKGTNPNPDAYDYKYPLIRVDGDWTAKSNGTTVSNNDRVSCLSCHFAHAGKFANSLRWDVKEQVAFLADGEIDGYGYASDGDNPAYGCNKCHRKGGSNAYR